MALFKQCRGTETNLPSTLTDGYCYFCTDTGNFYIDYTNTDGALVRSKISSKYADKLRYLQDGNQVELNPTNIVTNSNYDTLIGTVTTSKNGLMAATDKQKLDEIDSRTKTWFGTCTTAASVAQKVVTTNTGDFALEAGSVVYVQFNTTVTSSSTTLNVDSTGAIAIQTSATNALTANQIAPKTVAGFIYDGAVYRMLDGTIATTTYYGMTKLSSSTSSTSTATAATSSAVKAAYDLANSAVKQVIQATGAITPDDNGAITVDNVAYATNAAKLGDVASTEYLQKSGGTMSGNLIAANPAVGTQAVRNIYAGTADMTAGSSTLATGVIYCVYE